jgi:hypothetical protein
MKRKILTSLLVALAASGASAQDSNYWDTQFGTKGQMLGGLVVGSPSDLSATFYNPGWIAMDVDGTFLLTTQAVEVYQVKLKDGLGENFDLDSTKATTSPGYLAGRFTTDPDRTWNWAYSYLKRIQFDFDVRGVEIDPRTLPPTGEDWFAGEALRTARANEYWYGLTAARKVDDRIAIGFTPYVVYRSVSSRIQAAAQAIGTGGDFAQTYINDEYGYWHVRALAKIGLAVDRGNWSLGATLTTPSLGILGRGHFLAQGSLSGVDRDGDGAVDSPYVVGNYQEDLSASWASPLSLALGATWKPGRTGLHTTVEWFDAVSRSQAMEPESWLNQSTGAAVTPDIGFAADQVINFGVGLEHDFESKLSLYAAFRSDYTTNPQDGTDNLSLSNWNLWHVTTGAAFRFLNLEFNTGLQFSWGSHEAARFVNFNPDDGENVVTKPGDFRVNYRRIKVLLGFNLPMLSAENP